VQAANHRGVEALFGEVPPAGDLRACRGHSAQGQNFAGQLLRCPLERRLVETECKRQASLSGTHGDGSIC
jgi:hypothetical protein